MSNLLAKLTKPWYPARAIGLDKGVAALVQLERAKGGSCIIRRAASIQLPADLITPGFEHSNIREPQALAGALSDLAASAGLLKQKRWSVSLPETSARTFVLTLDNDQSSGELQEVLQWKMERAFGMPLEELSISRERLQKDSQQRDRYLVIAIKKTVLHEFESVFTILGWRIGLVLPRHFGEAQWLLRNGLKGDSLLLSASNEGFTAVIFRGKHPLIVRTVECDSDECEDELYRLLLFYRDKRTGESGNPDLGGLLVVGGGLRKERAGEIVNETIGADLRPLDPADLGLEMPSGRFDFNVLAGPAGLATLSW
ncbi:MAG: hypothetical protein ABR555_11790 [Pyrinomonadaceae bacterium]